MYVQNYANKMKHFAIIEDLDADKYQNLLHLNHEDILADCFIRNFSLIKKYAHSEDQLFITKFKKKLIPKYLQQLEQYCQSQVLKNRQQFYVRRKNFHENHFNCKKYRQSLSELNKNFLLNQFNSAASDQVLQPRSLQKSFPILFNEKTAPKKNPSSLNLSNVHIEKATPSQTLICGPMFLISPKKKNNELEKISSVNLSRSYANIYTDSINFCQNFLLKNNFDQIGSKRQSQQSTEGIIQIFNVKRTLADEKSIEKKMMNVLKKRKSSKNVKMKIFLGYMNAKKFSTEVKDKENDPKLSFNELSKQATQPLLKNKMGKLGLKGKLCIPMKNHRVMTSYLLEQPRATRQTFQVLDQIIDLPSINSRSNILNSTQNKLIWPKFS